jgi:hypothetical protein
MAFLYGVARGVSSECARPPRRPPAAGDKPQPAAKAAGNIAQPADHKRADADPILPMALITASATARRAG